MTIEKKNEIWEGTMAHAPPFGSLSYGSFTKVRLSNSAVKILEKLQRKKTINGAMNRADAET